MKINITIQENLLQRIDKYTEENYMTRSGFMSLACNQYLNQVDLMESLKEMKMILRKISETNELDSEAKRTLDAFEIILKNVQ